MENNGISTAFRLEHLRNHLPSTFISLEPLGGVGDLSPSRPVDLSERC